MFKKSTTRLVNRGLVAATVAALAALALAGCSQSHHDIPQQPRLVLLYSTCTVNKNFLSPYNPKVGFTPNLERFRQEGVLFSRHQTNAGMSGLAFASLFTGRHSDGHGVFFNPGQISGDVPQIFDAFASGGFNTWLWNNHPMANYALGYGRAVPKGQVQSGILRGANTHFRNILRNLQQDATARVFIATTFTITHTPYPKASASELPREFQHTGLTELEFLELRDLYYSWHETGQYSMLDITVSFDRVLAAEGLQDRRPQLQAALEYLYKVGIHRLDGVFGGVLEALDAFQLREDSLIVFTSDHGEMLGDSEALFNFTHGYELADEVVSVPLIVQLPHQQRAGSTYGGVTRSIDVLPTLSSFAQVSHDTAVEGQNLAPAILGRTKPPRILAYSHTPVFYKLSRNAWLRRFFPREGDPGDLWVGVRDGDLYYSITRTSPDGDFERSVRLIGSEDRRNRYSRWNPRHILMFRRLTNFKDRMIRGAERHGAPRLGKESDAQLRALGYL